MGYNDEIKNDILVRMNRIQGQIKGISKMISDEVYCDNILNQILAVDCALKSVGRLLMEAHIRKCVVTKIQSGELEIIDELMKTLKKLIS